MHACRGKGHAQLQEAMQVLFETRHAGRRGLSILREGVSNLHQVPRLQSGSEEGLREVSIVRSGAPHSLCELREADFLRRVLRGVRAETGGGVPEMPH